MTRLKRYYSALKRVSHNQWRILRSEGVHGNIASLRRFADNRRITGVFSNGLRTSVNSSAVTRAYRQRKQPIVIVIMGRARPEFRTWFDTVTRGLNIDVLLSSGAFPEQGRDLHRRVHFTPSLDEGGRLSGLRRELIRKFASSDVLFIDESGGLPSRRDVLGLHYAAHRYELTENSVGIVTPQLRVGIYQAEVNGFEWDRAGRKWHTAARRGMNYGQAAIPRYVLGAPLHGLYVRKEVMREYVEPDSASSAGVFQDDVRRLIRAGWKQGWRTLAYPFVSLDVEYLGTPFTTAQDLEWLCNRAVRTDSGQLRIIYILLATTVSGGIRTVFEQTEHLLDLGHDVEIWSLDGPPTWTTSRTPVVQFRNQRDLTKALSGENAIKVATWWETAQFVWLASVNSGIPVYYVQEFETWFYPDDAVARASVVASYRTEMDHIAIANYQGDELAQVGVESTTISSAYDPGKFGVLERVSRDATTVMAVGRTFFQKNFEMTLRAWRSLDEPRPTLSLFGFEPEIARDPGIAYVNRPSDGQINELYNRATVFVQTSLHEGFSLPILEAMAAGCPVITTDSHGNRDFCFDGENCIVVEQNDVQGLADAIRRVLGDSGLQETLRLAGLKTAQDYTWRVVAKKLEARYLSLA